MVYSLSQDHSTVSWRLTEPEMNTDFVCQKARNQLHVTVEIDGKSTKKTPEIGNATFFSNPSLGLWSFAQTSANQIDFWVLEPSRLSKHKMRAVNRGDETVTVNG